MNIVNEKIQNDQQTEFKFNKDPKLKDDTVINVGKHKTTYGEISSTYPINKQEPIRLLVYWDDICQYTSLGLIEILNSLLKADAKIDINHFLTRPNEYIYGIDYVKKLFEKSLTNKEISKIKQKYYWDILKISMKSTIFNSLGQTNSFYDRIGFYFPYRFANCLQLQQDLTNMFYKGKSLGKCEFYYATDIPFNKILSIENYNSIITPNIIGTYDYIIKNGLERISIIGPDGHNGVDDEMYRVFAKYDKYPKPNKCSVSMFIEQIII